MVGEFGGMAGWGWRTGGGGDWAGRCGKASRSAPAEGGGGRRLGRCRTAVLGALKPPEMGKKRAERKGGARISSFFLVSPLSVLPREVRTLVLAGDFSFVKGFLFIVVPLHG